MAIIAPILAGAAAVAKLATAAVVAVTPYLPAIKTGTTIITTGAKVGEAVKRERDNRKKQPQSP